MPLNQTTVEGPSCQAPSQDPHEAFKTRPQKYRHPGQAPGHVSRLGPLGQASGLFLRVTKMGQADFLGWKVIKWVRLITWLEGH
jgi:hypothetical protein